MKIPQKAIDRIGPALAKACEAIASGLHELAAKVQTFATDHPEAAQHMLDLANYREAEKNITAEIDHIKRTLGNGKEALNRSTEQLMFVRRRIAELERKDVP